MSEERIESLKAILALLLIVAGIPAAFVGGVAVEHFVFGGEPAAQQAPAGQELRAEYYRGLFDACIFFGVNYFSSAIEIAIRECGKFVDSAYANEWHKEESNGYKSPG